MSPRASLYWASSSKSCFACEPNSGIVEVDAVVGGSLFSPEEKALVNLFLMVLPYSDHNGLIIFFPIFCNAGFPDRNNFVSPSIFILPAALALVW